jgi:hypothetical protein
MKAVLVYPAQTRRPDPLSDAGDPSHELRQEGETDMSRSVSHLLAATGLAFTLAAVAACGSSTASATSATGTTPGGAPTSVTATGAPGATRAPVASIGLTPAGSECPTAAKVNTALGTSLSSPNKVTGGGSTTLPAGASAISCDYTGPAMNVLITLITNFPAASIDLFSSKFPVTYTTVSGVGDQARSFSQSLGAGRTNESVVATKGTSLVDITATATPASLAQVEALVGQLL